MDFRPSEEQTAVTEAAQRVFAEEATPERVAATEAEPERFDRALWKKLAEANLLGLVLPESAGGSDMGLLELCLLLEQQGRRVAPVPLWPTLALGALPLVTLGATEEALLTAVGTGDAVLTAAVAEPLAGWPLPVTATREGDGWRLDGASVNVPAGQLADAVLVPARLGDGGTGVFVVDPTAPGVTLERAVTTDRGLHPRLRLDAVRTERRVGGADAADRLLDIAVIGLCAVQVGVVEEALRQTAEYTSQRRQFGRPLASFQGVTLRVADGYIDTEAMRVTMLQAAWRLATGRDATRQVAVAAWWAADAGHRVVHAVQHLHGGLGADIDYPVHRYFLWAVQAASLLAGGGPYLARLGGTL